MWDGKLVNKTKLVSSFQENGKTITLNEERFKSRGRYFSIF